MKALSVKQPFAVELAYWGKHIEFRSKPTAHRGSLLICSSKSQKAWLNVDPPVSLPLGAMLGVRELIDCRPMIEADLEEFGAPDKIEAGISFDAMGFDNLDVEMLFDGDGRFTDIFPDSPEVSDAKDALREVKEHRKESTERMKEDQAIEFYFVVVCKDKGEKDAILRRLKMPLHEKYVSGGVVDSAING